MKYLIKNEKKYNGFETMEIYHTTNKILETTNNTLWNATEKNPLGIAKSRMNDYIVSDELLTEENDG